MGLPTVHIKRIYQISTDIKGVLDTTLWSFHGLQVNESFDCEDEDENRDALSFDRPELQQRLSVHSAVEVGGRRHSGKTVTFCERRLSDYTCYSHGDHNKVSGVIKILDRKQ
jgi:hypothetical protein